jgi:hypothetical protein
VDNFCGVAPDMPILSGMTKPLKRKPIRTEHDLLERWQELMGEEGFGRRSLWLIFLDEDGKQADVVMPVDDVPLRPDPREVLSIARFVGRLREEANVSEVPMLLSRPGPSAMTAVDRAWAVALTAAMADQQPRWPIHLATCDRVQVFAADDLVECRAS